MTTDANIRTRIESLLRLAEDPNATQGERDNAIDRVATLTEKYKIDASRLDPHSGQWVRENIEIHTFHLPSTYGISNDRHHGVYQVVEAMGAAAYLVKQGHRRRNGGQRYVLEGITVHATASTMQVLKVLIPSLVLQETSANTAFIAGLKKTEPDLVALQDLIRMFREGGADPKKYVNDLNRRIKLHRKSFCFAFFVEAAKRITAKRADAVQEADNRYALVVVDTADRIAQSLADKELTQSQNRRSYSATGWEGGTEAGQQAMVGQTEVRGGRLAIEGC